MLDGKEWADKIYEQYINSIPHILIEEIGEYELYCELGIPEQYWLNEQHKLEEMYYA